MKSFLRKALGVYPGEGKTTFHFSICAIILAFGISITETISISLFIEKIGSKNLPLNYLVTSSGMILVSCLFLYFLRRTTPKKIFLSVLVLASIFFLITTTCIYFNAFKYFWQILLIFTTIFAAALIACFWNFIDHFHDLQDAKRVYGVFNASYYAGAVLSGFFINKFYAKFGPIIFYLIAAISFIIVFREAIQISKKLSAFEDDMVEELFSVGKKNIFKLLTIFFKSPFTLALVLTSIIVQLIINCTEYSYMSSFEKVFASAPNSEAAICEFLGKCKAFISLGNIVTGLFFYRRLVKKLRLSNMLILPPLIFVVLYSRWSLFDSVALAIFAVIAVEGVLFTFEDNNFNLLINAAPSKLKGSLRIINDSFFEPIGMLISSFFLLFLQGNSKFLGLILSFVFFTSIFLVRHYYPKSIIKNLKENTFQFEKKILSWLSISNKKEFIEDLFKILTNESDEKLRLIAFEKILLLNDKKLLPKLLYNFSKFSEIGKIKVLKFLSNSSFSGDFSVIELVNNLLKNASKNVYKKARFFLAKQGLLHPDNVKCDLENDDLMLRATAIITLKTSLANKSLESYRLNLTIANRELDLLLNSNDSDEICMGLSLIRGNILKNHIKKIISYFNHDSLYVKREAAKTLAKISKKSFFNFTSNIIKAIKNESDNVFRINCLKALGKIQDISTVKDILTSSINFRPNEKRELINSIVSMGLTTVPILLSILINSNINIRSRILSSKILGNISTLQLQANIEKIISNELEIANFYFYNAHTIAKKYKTLDLKLLENALIAGYKSIIDFIIHMLGASGAFEDSDIIIHALHSKCQKQHAQAVETVEKSLPEKIFRKIKFFIDDSPWEIKKNAYLKINKNHVENNFEDILKRLEKSPSHSNKAIVMHLKVKLKLPNQKKSIINQIKTCDETFHHYAYEILEV